MSRPASAWRSARLFFKGIEDTDDAFLFEMRSDSVAVLNTSPALPAPPKKQDATKYREFMQKCPLGVIICLSTPAPPAPSSPPPNSPPPPTTAINTALFNRTPEETLIPIGDMHLRAEDNPSYNHHRSVEIGISIHADYQGQGYGSEAIRWVLEWAFQRANLHRVGIGALSWNDGAVRLYQKVGFDL
jgi:ribosomal protein S18 acetylase RimI-like enzyme